MTKSVSHILRITAFAAALALASALGAHAQTAPAEGEAGNDEQVGEASTGIKTLPPAYESQMLRLSEILGALHYLRELCGANEGQLWRDQMANVIEQEDPTPERKAAMVASFNRGFRSFREIHRECSQTAVEASNRYLRQGVRLSAEIPDRYGR